MKCPFCSSLDNKVIDSRLAKDSEIIRRRRECEACQKRFTTYERVEETMPFVIKKDGRREPYDRLKIISGIKKACEKRPISIETLEQLTSDVENEMTTQGVRELRSQWIGERLMQTLKQLDEVAYVRFASVYRSFKDVGEFVSLIENRGSP